jgi:hypothetical protein
VTKSDDFIVDFLREFEAIFKKALTRVSGALGELLDEKKNKGRKSLCQGPFNKKCWISDIKNSWTLSPNATRIRVKARQTFF